MTAEQLGSTIITTDTTPIRLVSQEVEVSQSIGVALLIVGIDPRRNGDNATDPLIWTITELEAKADTDKRPGDVSIPAETIKKVGENGLESQLSNVLGALAEFCDDSNVPQLLDNLFLVDGLYRKKGITIKNNPVDLAVLVYSGSLDIPFAPESAAEVKANGWINKSKIRRMDGVRSVLTQAIERDALEGLTVKAIEAYYSNSGMIKVFSPGFSMKRFYAERETLSDVPICPRIKQS